MGATAPFDFSGQRVVVIGGTSGIGLGAAQLFAELGAKVIIASRSQDKVDAAVKTIGNGAVGHTLDATKDDQVQQFFEKVGDVHHIVASSGRKKDVPFLQATPEDLWTPWEVKYWTYVKAARYGAPRIKSGGSITFIGGGNGTKPGKNSHQAAGVNAATEALARALALDLSPICVNVVSPGIVDTSLWDQLQPNVEAREATFQQAASKLPAKKIGSPDEVARIIVAVASSPFATGSVYHVNGGAFLV